MMSQLVTKRVSDGLQDLLDLLFASHNLPDGLSIIILLTVWTEFSEVSETAGKASSETECEGWHQQPMYSLFSELSLCPLLKTKKSADAGQEEEHGHVPDVHTHSEPEVNQVPGVHPVGYDSDIVGEVGPVYECRVVDQNAPGQHDADHVNVGASRGFLCSHLSIRFYRRVF